MTIHEYLYTALSSKNVPNKVISKNTKENYLSSFKALFTVSKILSASELDVSDIVLHPNYHCFAATFVGIGRLNCPSDLQRQ